MRVISVYVPNGQSIEADKFLYKMEFLERLYLHFERLLYTATLPAICGCGS